VPGTLAVKVQPLTLVIRAELAARLGTLVPLQAKPAQVFHQLLIRGLDVAGLVSVLDAQHELAA
jgi:hypothetical protein